MPRRAFKVCAYPNCGAIVEASAVRCDLHPYPPRPDKPRSRASRDGLGPGWRVMRRELLKREPMCRACRRAKATHLDHIVSRRRGGPSDPSNLQPLCASCHSRKTASEDGGFGNRRSV